MTNIIQELQLKRLGKGGFIDKHGRVILVHEHVVVPSHFSNGLYCAKTGSSAYFINLEGNNVFGRTFYWAETFSEGLASVCIDGSWGFIDTQGEFVIRPQYEDVSSFSDGLAAAQVNGDWGFINRNGEWAVPPRYENVLPFSEERGAVSLNGMIAFIDLRGETITEFQFDEVGSFSNGLAETITYETADELHNRKYIDRRGRVAIDFDYVYEELTGSSAVDRGRDGFWDISDRYMYSGRRKTKHRMTSNHKISIFDPPSGQFCDGLLLVASGGKCGYMNTCGELVIPFQFFDATVFSEGLASVFIEADLRGNGSGRRNQHETRTRAFINKAGDVVIDNGSFDYVRSFKDGAAYVAKGNERWFVNKNGEKICEIITGLGVVGDFYEGIAPIQERNWS